METSFTAYLDIHKVEVYNSTDHDPSDSEFDYISAVCRIARVSGSSGKNVNYKSFRRTVCFISDISNHMRTCTN